jgi:hypothetical protein
MGTWAWIDDKYCARNTCRKCFTSTSSQLDTAIKTLTSVKWERGGRAHLDKKGERTEEKEEKKKKTKQRHTYPQQFGI